MGLKSWGGGVSRRRLARPGRRGGGVSRGGASIRMYSYQEKGITFIYVNKLYTWQILAKFAGGSIKTYAYEWQIDSHFMPVTHFDQKPRKNKQNCSLQVFYFAVFLLCEKDDCKMEEFDDKLLNTPHKDATYPFNMILTLLKLLNNHFRRC